MTHDFILQSLAFDGEGGGEPIDKQAISEHVEGQQLAWVHLDVNAAETKDWIKDEVSYLDPVIIDALLTKDTRPRVTEIENGFLIILRGVNMNPGAEPEDMVSLRMWIDPHRIITLQRRPLKTVSDIAEKLAQGRGPKDQGDFLTMICAHLFDYIDTALNDLGERTDDVEEYIMDDPDAAFREKINEIRKEAIVFKRYIQPQRDVIAQLRASEMSWLSAHDKRSLQESYNHLVRYVEDLDTVRERAQIVKEELNTVLSDQLNKNLYILSVIAAIFLPLGFLTGLFGINIGGMPGVENDLAFWIFCGFLTAVTLIQIIIFKIMRWF